MDTLVLEIVQKLEVGLREEFEERAAIMEYDAGYPRDHAECLALLDVLRRNPPVLLGTTPSV